MQPKLQRPQSSVSWKRVQSIPNKMLQPEVVPTKDIIYVGGGLGNSSTLSLSVFAYNIAEDKWHTLPETHTALFGMCFFDNSLITVGGICEDGIIGKVYRLDEEKNWWEDFLPAMPTGRFSMSIFSTDSVLVACGGGVWRDGENIPTSCSVVEVYRHESKTWLSAGNLPRPSAAMSSTMTDNMCYLLSDDDECCPIYMNIAEISANIAEISDTEGDSQSKKVTSSKHANSTKKCSKTPKLNWRHFPPPPIANTSIIGTSSYLLAIGGQNKKGAVRGVHIYIKESRKWWQLAHGELPQRLQACGLAILDTTGEIMVVGGEDSEGMFTDSVFIGKLL